MVNLDPDEFDEAFRILHRWSSSIPAYPARYVGEFLAAGDWHLSLDTIAGVCLENNVFMPPYLFATFQDLAAKLQLETDPEYTAVGEFMRRQSEADLSPTK